MSNTLKEKIRNCSLCASYLPLGPRPVVQFCATSRILIAGQAPGKAVHNSGVPFDDPSGERLRRWLNVSGEIFYNERHFAILPMAFCYPGKGTSGDLAPRKECIQQWRSEVLEHLDNVQLTLVIGQYAMAYHLPSSKKKNLTETVRQQDLHSTTIALPHPSPRNNIWFKKNPWFEDEMVPLIQQKVQRSLSFSSS